MSRDALSPRDLVRWTLVALRVAGVAVFGYLAALFAFGGVASALTSRLTRDGTYRADPEAATIALVGVALCVLVIYRLVRSRSVIGAVVWFASGAIASVLIGLIIGTAPGW